MITMACSSKLLLPVGNLTLTRQNQPHRRPNPPACKEGNESAKISVIRCGPPPRLNTGLAPPCHFFHSRLAIVRCLSRLFSTESPRGEPPILLVSIDRRHYATLF